MPSDTFLPFSLFCQIFSILNNKTAKQPKLSHFNTASDLQMYIVPRSIHAYYLWLHILCQMYMVGRLCLVFQGRIRRNSNQQMLHWHCGKDSRNKSNIFSVHQGINQKRSENCIIVLSALLQKFSVLFWVDTSINRKNIRFISYHFNSKKNLVILTLINTGLFQTVDVVEIQMTSQYSFLVDAKIISIF